MKNKEIKGIKKIAGESKSLGGYYSGQYLQINFDTSTGEAWSNQHCDFGHGSRVVYHDKSIINCGTISEPTKMTEIREMIEDAVMRAEYESMIDDERRQTECDWLF